MKFQRIRRRVVEFPINSVIGGVQLLAEGARAEPEPVPKMELRRVTATRVEHWEKQNFFPLRNPVVIVNKLVSNISLCFFKENLHKTWRIPTFNRIKLRDRAWKVHCQLRKASYVVAEKVAAICETTSHR